MNNESFLKPVLSTLGLVLSFFTAIAPFFSIDPLTKYFISKDLAYPSSIAAVIFGIIITWMVLNFYSYLEWNFKYFKIGQTKVIWILLLVAILMFGGFFVIPKDPRNIMSVLQAINYILFFNIIIFLFSLLMTITKSRYEYLDVKDRQAELIYTTLERNRLINPGIKIFSNELVTQKERTDLDIRYFGMARKIKLRTVPQNQEDITVVMSDDFRELVKVITHPNLDEK